MIRALNRVVEVIAIVVGMVILYKAGVYLTRPTGLPVLIHSVEAVNSPVPAGNDLIARIHRDKYRKCPVTSRRFVQDPTGTPILVDSETWAGGDVSSPSVDVVYDTRALPSGDYVLLVHLTYSCPEAIYEVTQPPLRFRVEER